jgi:surface-anchored protein
MKHITALSIPLALALSQPVSAASYITGGHIDVPAFGYDTADGFEPHIHNEGGADGAIINGVRETTATEYAPDELIVFVNPSSTVTLGTTTYYWLPQDETAAFNNGVPFVGIGLEELESTDWVNGIVSLTLLNITGPGQFRLWQTDAFDNVTDFINTETNTLTFDLAAGSHSHYNWGFTELGVYELEFQISGTHIVDQFQSGAATFTYAVPEPSTALLAFGGLTLAIRRRR